MNGFKVTFLMLGLMALFMWLGHLFGGTGGMIIAFMFACGINFFSYWFSDKMVLKMYKARQIQEADHPKLFRVVKRVATQAMMPMPRVYIVPSRAPNAFATGRNVENSAVAATEGLLELLNEDELEGVIGHEIAHIRNKDMLIGMVAATFAGAIGMIAQMAQFGAMFGGMGGRDEEDRGGGMIGVLVAAIVAPLVAMVIQFAISRQREYAADAEGGRITGKFLPLASALKKLHSAPARMNLDQHPSTAHLMIANPISGKGLTSLFSTHPPVETRVAKLQELAQTAVYQPYVG